MTTLNSADPRPLYQQLASLLRDQIRSGDLPPGERIPTEAELADRYDASRNTIRLALDVLRNEGLIISRQGRGNFVRAEPPMRYHASLTGSRRKRLEANRAKDTFTQQVEAHGKTPRQVSTVQTIPAGSEAGSWLALAPEDRVTIRRRVMYADDEPIQLGDSYYPLAIVQDSKIMNEENIPEGTDQVLEDLGHIPTRYEDEITWRMPTAEETTMLRIDPGIPVAQVIRVSFDQHDERIEAYVVILPGDRHILRYEVDAQ